MAVDVAMRSRLPFAGVLLGAAAVVDAAVLGPRRVDAAGEMVRVERGALEHRLTPSVVLVGPSDDADVGARGAIDRSCVRDRVPAVVVAHELTAAARCLASGAVGKTP